MSGYSTHYPGIFVVDLALHYAMPKRGVAFGRWNMSLVWISGEIEAGLDEVEWSEDLLPAEGVQRFPSNPLQGNTEQDEADIAVFRVGAWICRKGKLEYLGQELTTVSGCFKQLYVRRQAG